MTTNVNGYGRGTYSQSGPHQLSIGYQSFNHTETNNATTHVMVFNVFGPTFGFKNSQ